MAERRRGNSLGGRRDRLIGFLCEWSGKLDHRLGPDQELLDVPGVKVIKLMCSGMVKPEWVELALKSGAAGCFVVGCPRGDCHFREGNVFINERLLGLRPPKLKTRDVDPERIAVFFRGAEEWPELIEDIKAFRDRCLARAGEEPAPQGGRQAAATKARTAEGTAS